MERLINSKFRVKLIGDLRASLPFVRCGLVLTNESYTRYNVSSDNNKIDFTGIKIMFKNKNDRQIPENVHTEENNTKTPLGNNKDFLSGPYSHINYSSEPLLLNQYRIYSTNEYLVMSHHKAIS